MYEKTESKMNRFARPVLRSVCQFMKNVSIIIEEECEIVNSAVVISLVYEYDIEAIS